jgi:integrase
MGLSKMARRGNREGTICKRKDGRWCGAVTVGYNPKTGKPIRKFLYGKTRQEVAEKLARILPQVNTGLVSPEKYTLGDWFHIWLEYYKRPGIRKSTYERYAHFAQNHILPALGKLHLERLRPEVLQGFFAEKEGFAPNTVKFIYVILHSALEKAVELGYLPRNPADCVSLPKRRQKEIRILSPQEMQHFLSCARKHRLYPAFLLLASTGMRRSEVLGLRWQDVDLEKGLVTVNQVLIPLIRGIGFEEPKTKQSRRTIPLLPEVVEELREWRKRWLEERMGLGPDWPETDLVFPSEVHTPLLPRNFTRVFHAICREARLENFTIHGLRHSFASYLLAKGVHPKVVSEVLGHSSITITMDTYSKLIPGLKEMAVEKLRDLFKGVL